MVRFSFAMCLVVAACTSGGGSKAKGGGAKGTDAQSAGQKSGGTAESDHSKGTDKGNTYDGVTCDATTDGLAWCDSDTDIALCAGGEWWLLDCSSPEIGGDFCGDDGQTVDCYAASEF
jgi:hypothetical protein